MFHKITPKLPGLEHVYQGTYGTLAINRPAGGGLSPYYGALQSFGAVTMFANAVLRITVPPEDAGFKTSAAIMTNGQIVGSFPGTGGQSAFVAIDQIPSFGFVCTTAAADAKTWDNYADSTGTMHFRTLTDAGNSTNWMVVTRSGGVPTSVSISPSLQINGIAASSVSYVDAPASITTTDTYLGTPLSIPANALAANNSFRITIHGACTSSAANAISFALRFGVNGTTADAAVGTTGFTSGTSGVGNGFKITMYIQFATVGSSGTANVYFDLIDGAEPPTGITTASVTVNPELNGGTPVTVNTSVASKVGVSVKTAAATTSLQIFSTVIERLF